MRAILFVFALLTALSLHAREIVIRAAHVLDGRGHDLGQIAVVVRGTKIEWQHRSRI